MNMIIPSTSQSKGRKRVFTNVENKALNKKFQQESKSNHKVSEQENGEQPTINKKSEKMKKSVSNKIVVSPLLTQKYLTSVFKYLDYIHIILQTTNFISLSYRKMLIAQREKS